MDAPDHKEERDFSSEFRFSASRSGGPGGQNVNKVSTKVELRFHVTRSNLLSEEEKEMILDKLKSRINAEGELVLASQSERSQLKNKEKVIERFYILITKALTPEKERKHTKPSKASKEKRLKEKKATAEKKKLRSDDDLIPE